MAGGGAAGFAAGLAFRTGFALRAGFTFARAGRPDLRATFFGFALLRDTTFFRFAAMRLLLE
jgi:hypothetical protein